ncbi:MAG: hypothetical protein IPM07_30685 [Anaerolineales bacterium]|nr:hypothetical protein [Anaerolineales bacterium]
MNQLEAENRRLRAELLAQTQRADAQSRIIANLQRENETAALQLAQLAAVATVATQQAQAGRGFILNENPLDRVCRN